MEVIKQRLAELLLSSFTYCLAMLVALTIIMHVLEPIFIPQALNTGTWHIYTGHPGMDASHAWQIFIAGLGTAQFPFYVTCYLVDRALVWKHSRQMTGLEWW